MSNALAWVHSHYDVVSTVSYLAASSLFILGLKYLGSPATARKGNVLGAAGMALAVVVTLLRQGFVGMAEVALAVAVGSVVGLVAAFQVEMTKMPQMVAIFNGLGGGASALVAIAEYVSASGGDVPKVLYTDASLSAYLGAVIGAVTLSGSLVAYLKLDGRMNTKPIVWAGQQLQLGLLGLVVVGGTYVGVTGAVQPWILVVLSVLSLAVGVLLTIPIGGADMPVVIALLNSYSGLAASMAGFALNNNVLIISGALVGASGLILTDIMCRAMNRSIWNVIFGAFGATVQSGGAGDGKDQVHKATDPESAAMMLAYADSVVFVPGYGMAVAQAQHEVRELADVLEKKGVTVRFAIHPVAGRMPGHMNVLLAEANVPYPALVEMEDINPEFDRTDVAVVIGANDVVNPSARSDTTSPIYGMPILDVDKSKTVIVLKRSMNPGFAGIQNQLFFDPKTYMLFGDAKDSVGSLVKECKSL